MPNRTLKAIQGQWTSIIVQMRELGMEGEGNTAAPKAKTRKLLFHSRLFSILALMNVFEARKKAAPKQKAAAAGDGQNANEDTGDDQDDEETKKKATPKKRAAATNTGECLVATSSAKETVTELPLNRRYSQKASYSCQEVGPQGRERCRV